MIFNRAAASALPGQLAELKTLKRRLQERHGRKTLIDIKVASKKRFLHTKLYHFRRGKWARTLIGSANATENGFCRNDELLVEIHGRDNTIEGYIDYTSDSASSCEDPAVGVDEYDSFQAMLRDGFVYFKSNRPVPYTLNCFENHPDVRDALERAVVSVPLPFHEDQSVGLLNILKLLGISSSEKAEVDEEAQRAVLAPFSVETCFGFWVPYAFHQELDSKIDASASKKAARLFGHGQSLISKSDSQISADIQSRYFTVIDQRLAGVSAPRLNLQQKREVEARVLRRVLNLRSKLAEREECMRLARAVSGAPVPEMWEDPRSKREMMESFCEYVSWKLESTSRKRRIVRKLQEWFALSVGDEPHDVQRKIDSFFEAGKTIRRQAWDNGS